MSWLEIAAALLGLINVALIVQRNIWNYPFGIVMVAIYGAIFFRANLYSDAALQMFFLIIQFYGWRNWLHARGERGLIHVDRLTSREQLYWTAVIIAWSVIEGWLLMRYTQDAAPWMDAVTTALSVVAQYLLSVRKIENWLLWIVADVIQIDLYFWKSLYPTTALYAVFLILSITGYVGWQRELRRRTVS